jgi:hypothetical protein
MGSYDKDQYIQSGDLERVADALHQIERHASGTKNWVEEIAHHLSDIWGHLHGIDDSLDTLIDRQEFAYVQMAEGYMLRISRKTGDVAQLHIGHDVENDELFYSWTDIKERARVRMERKAGQ